MASIQAGKGLEEAVLSKCHLVFDESGRREKELKKELQKAYKKIGELQVEIDFLSDVLKRAQIRKGEKKGLVFITYKDKGERQENQILMELIDKKYQHDPTYGASKEDAKIPSKKIWL